jgi:hypothetical protein
VNHREEGYLARLTEEHPEGFNVILEMLANVNLENDFSIAAKGERIRLCHRSGLCLPLWAVPAREEVPGFLTLLLRCG